MTLGYLYSKFVKKVLRWKSIRNSCIDRTAVIYSGTSFTDSSLGRYSYCGYDCEIDNADIGSFCSISDHVFIGGAEHPLSWLSTSPVFQDVSHSGPTKKFASYKLPAKKRTTIGNDVWIGHAAAIKQGVIVGNGAVVATGAVVTKDVPSYAIVAGVPAKVINYRFSFDVINRLEEIKWWDLPNDDIDKVIELFNIENPTLDDLERYFPSNNR